MARLDGAKGFSVEKGYFTVAVGADNAVVATNLNILFGGYADICSTAAPAAADLAHPGFTVTATATGSNAGFVPGTGVTFYTAGTSASSRNFYYHIEGAS